MRNIGEGLFVWDQLRSPDEYSSLNEEIEALNLLDLRNVSDTDLKKALDRVGRGYVTRRMWSIPKTSFRARRVTDELFSHASQLVAPPAKFVGPGRFNAKKQPVRYFANDPSTALMECRAKPHDLFALLVMRARPMKKPLWFVQFGLSKVAKSEAYERGNVEGVLDGLAIEPNLRARLESLGIRDHWLKQELFFSELATAFFEPAEAEARYRLSNALGRQMQRVRDVSGMFYPTAQNNYNGFNVAMPERLAAAAFAPLEVWLIEMGERVDPVGVGPRFWQGSVVRRGSVDGAGTIDWGGPVRLSPEALHLEIAPMLPDFRGTVGKQGSSERRR